MEQASVADLSELGRQALQAEDFDKALAEAALHLLKCAVQELYPRDQLVWPCLRGAVRCESHFLPGDQALLVLRDLPPGNNDLARPRLMVQSEIPARGSEGPREWFAAVRRRFGLVEADTLFLLPVRTTVPDPVVIYRSWKAKKADGDFVWAQAHLNLVHHARLLRLPDPNDAVAAAPAGEGVEGAYTAPQVARLLAAAGEETRDGRALTANALRKRIQKAKADGTDPYARLARIRDKTGRFPKGGASRIIAEMARVHGRELKEMREVFRAVKLRKKGLFAQGS